jgi:hypothetical protein
MVDGPPRYERLIAQGAGSRNALLRTRQRTRWVRGTVRAPGSNPGPPATCSTVGRVQVELRWSRPASRHRTGEVLVTHPSKGVLKSRPTAWRPAKRRCSGQSSWLASGRLGRGLAVGDREATNEAAPLALAVSLPAPVLCHDADQQPSGPQWAQRLKVEGSWLAGQGSDISSTSRPAKCARGGGIVLTA